MAGLPRLGASPSTSSSPATGRSRPSSSFKKVDLPAPFGPSTATNSPRRTSKVAPRQIARPPYPAARSRPTTTGPSPPPSPWATCVAPGTALTTPPGSRRALARGRRAGRPSSSGRCPSRARSSRTPRRPRSPRGGLLADRRRERGDGLDVVDEHLEGLRFDLTVEGDHGRGRRVVALGDGVHERGRRHEVEVERLGQVLEDALGRGDRDPGEATLDRRQSGAVAGERGLDRTVALGEVGGLGRLDALVGRRQLVDDLEDVGRVVPKVGIAAGRHVHERADVDDGPPICRVGREQLRRPGVVPRPVHDHEAGLGEGPGVGGGALVVVRIGVRVVDDARDLRLASAELRGEAAPDVLRGDHGDHPGAPGVRRRARAVRTAPGEGGEQAPGERGREGAGEPRTHTVTVTATVSICNGAPPRGSLRRTAGDFPDGRATG